METVDDIEVDLSLLPEELQPLAPLIRKYAAGDDVVRVERLESASNEDLQAITTAIKPHWDAVNAFLDANMDPPGPLQDVAIVLGYFAEAAAEASVVLEERSE